MQKRNKVKEEDRDSTDFLKDPIWTGVQQLIAQAHKVEVAAFLPTHADQRDKQGHARIVLSGPH